MVCCSALNCQNATSGANKNSSVSFHGFPLENKPLLEQWIQNMGRDMATPSRSQRLCSAHFQESSFQRDPLKFPKRRQLLRGAVPNKFLLGQDGSWLVGTPRNSGEVVRKKTRKQLWNPEHWTVSGKFPNGAEWPTLEDWQNEFYKTVLKEIYGSLTTRGKDHPIPKSIIPAGEAVWAKTQQDLQGRSIPDSLGAGCGGAQLQSGAATQLQGSFPGGSQTLRWHVSDTGEILRSHQTPPKQANPGGNGSSSSFPAEGQLQGSQQLRVSQQIQGQEAVVPWFICTDCGNSFARRLSPAQHQEKRPHKCLECRKSFLEKCRFMDHPRTRGQITRVPSAFLG